jgi:hypothetical protein
LEDVFALWAFKGPQIGPGGTGFDLGQHHAALAFRATRTFNREQGWFGTIVRVGHVMHLFGSGGSATLSVTPTPIQGGDGTSMLIKVPESRSITLTFQKN